MSQAETLLAALTLQAGWNAGVVALGAALLGASAGAAGAFMYLRKRALVSDAVAHATLPGVCVAFIAMVALGLDGRWLPGLLAGAAASAVLGLLTMDWLTRRTRLAEDAAIGAVLSVFFGLGIVGLTVIQSLGAGRAAGLEGLLLGAAAGMLQSDALVIAAGGALTAAAAFVLRRPMLMVAFDADHARALGVNVRAMDLAMMGLVTAVTVVGLKIVGLVLIVALLIIPPVAARFWTERADAMVLISALVGGVAGWTGAAVSASAPALPTGPVVVLACFAAFAVSLALAPARGALFALLRRRRFQARVHRRQGLLAVSRGEPVLERFTRRLLRSRGLMRADGVPTEAGRGEAARARLDEARWAVARLIHRDDAVVGRYDGLTPIEDVLTADEIAEIDGRLAPRCAGGPA